MTAVGTRGERVSQGSGSNPRGGRAVTERFTGALLCAIAGVLTLASPAASAPPTPGAYQDDDYLGFRNVLPPGQNGFASFNDNFAFLVSNIRPPHNNDQLDMYANLVYESSITESTVDGFYKDASFGVQPADVEKTYTPDCNVISAPSPNSEHCDDVTIQRDDFGVPHIYGADRAAALFAAGYTGAEDRLAFMDVERNAGRARLSSFLGGGSAAGDRNIWRSAPYTEDDLQDQFDAADDLYGAEGAQLQEDVDKYVDGINQYIAEARAGPVITQPGSKIPGFYGLINKPAGPDEWEVTDVVATASLIAGIFGKGGGRETTSALILEKAAQKFGDDGDEVWHDFRSQEDDEHVNTVHDTDFPYGTPPANPAGQALPDPGTTVSEPVLTRASGGEAKSKSAGVLNEFMKLEDTSNALLVSGEESATGKPLAVMGPQVSYYTPQILTEMDIHAPSGPEGPALDARGVGFTGISMYVLLGRGQDYAWSATSAGQDIIDTYALKLCEPGPDPVTLQSDHYSYDGNCKPFEVLERTNSWTPNTADSTPAGSETLRSLRTDLGIVTHRAMIGGEPVAYTQLRATYMHEPDGARGFADFNSPDAIASAEDYQDAAAKIDYTFNWFYADSSDIAYFNSGANPVRPADVDESLPVEGDPQYVWENFDPATMSFDREPPSAHPQVVNQDYISNWNNKQADEFSAADDTFSYTSVHRGELLSDRIEAGIAGAETMSRAELVEAMEDAGTADVRGAEVFPVVEQLLRSGPKTLKRQPKKVKRALNTLSAWSDSGAHRIDANHDGTYEDTAAIRLMDAWWPRLVRAQFQPTLGEPLFLEIQKMMGLHNRAGPGGSAYGSGWYGYVDKDLRSVLGEPVTDPLSREYCGKGRLGECRQRLFKSLKGAVNNKADADIGYPANPCPADNDGVQGDAQWCYDAIRHTAIGAITQPPIHTINRPTFQQAVAPEGHRP
jgi:acyl-homoserine lactone acylase PvdQ